MSALMSGAEAALYNRERFYSKCGKWQLWNIVYLQKQSQGKLQNEPCSVHNSRFWSLFIHQSFNHNVWGKLEKQKTGKQETKQIIMCDAPVKLLPGGWQFLILWHPESQTGQRTSWCLCLPVETLQRVKCFKNNNSLCGHTTAPYMHSIHKN